MKKIIIVLAFMLLATNALALQEVAGPVVISTPIGGSNSSLYGLINDGNATVVVSLRAEGDAAKYLSFPANVSLVPKKLVYTNITASIPSDYSTTGNITGSLYALQEGTPGQVRINIQLMKSVIISVYEQPKQGTSSGQTSQGASSSPNEAISASMLVALISDNYYVVILVIALLVIAFILCKAKRKKAKKPQRRKAKK
ncbi:MAG: hypothetical protein NT129_00870 [Candidatus Aenigmarchaeota archaeon]|nr:hypothetical protein [Candidatus Aenigmarchaeota archaeon]